MTNIERLNLRLRDALGLAGDGVRARFKWVFSTESVYYFRANDRAAFERHAWSERIGPCWMLCQWRPPLLTETQWKTRGATQMRESGDCGLIIPCSSPSLADNFPYPARGEYYAQPETALAPGVEPNDEWTSAYIHVIGLQLSKDARAHKRDIDAEIEKDTAARDARFYEMVQDTAPAFENYEPGARGNHVSFGGV